MPCPVHCHQGVQESKKLRSCGDGRRCLELTGVQIQIEVQTHKIKSASLFTGVKSSKVKYLLEQIHLSGEVSK